LKKIVAFFVFV